MKSSLVESQHSLSKKLLPHRIFIYFRSIIAIIGLVQLVQVVQISLLRAELATSVNQFPINPNAPSIEITDQHGSDFLEMRVPFGQMGEVAQKILIEKLVDDIKGELQVMWSDKKLPTSVESYFSETTSLLQIDKKKMFETVREHNLNFGPAKRATHSTESFSNHLSDSTAGDPSRIDQLINKALTRPSGAFVISGLDITNLAKKASKSSKSLSLFNGTSLFLGWVAVPYCVYRFKKIALVEGDIAYTDPLMRHQFLPFKLLDWVDENVLKGITWLSSNDGCSEVMRDLLDKKNPDNFARNISLGSESELEPGKTYVHYGTSIESQRQLYIFFIGDFLAMGQANQVKKANVKGNIKANSKAVVKPKSAAAAKLSVMDRIKTLMPTKLYIGSIHGNMVSPEEFTGLAVGLKVNVALTNRNKNLDNSGGDVLRDLSVQFAAGEFIRLNSDDNYFFSLVGVDFSVSKPIEASLLTFGSTPAQPFFEYARNIVINLLDSVVSPIFKVMSFDSAPYKSPEKANIATLKINKGGLEVRETVLWQKTQLKEAATVD